VIEEVQVTGTLGLVAVETALFLGVFFSQLITAAVVGERLFGGEKAAGAAFGLAEAAAMLCALRLFYGDGAGITASAWVFQGMFVSLGVFAGLSSWPLLLSFRGAESFFHAARNHRAAAPARRPHHRDREAAGAATSRQATSTPSPSRPRTPRG